MEYELRLTTFQLNSLERILFDCVTRDCEQITQMIADDTYSVQDIKRHGDACSDIGVIIEKIKKSRESGKK